MLCNFLVWVSYNIKEKYAHENNMYYQPSQNQPKSQILFHKKWFTVQLVYIDFGKYIDRIILY